MTPEIIRAVVDDHDALQQVHGRVPVVARQQVGAAPPVPACTTLTLPVPPSVNNLFSNSVRGRFRTPKYKAWLAEAGWKLREQLPDPIMGRVVIIIGVERSNLRADLDNMTKALLDLLTWHKVIEDDRFVTGLVMAWMPQGKRREPIARVMIRPADPVTLNFYPAPDGATGGWFIDAPEGEDIGD
jgi:Holliday junction resolvase RusA-like endonuclease